MGWTTEGRQDHDATGGARKRPFLSLSFFVGAMLAAALAPGRPASALVCRVPVPLLYLDLESVTVDGVEVEEPAEAWAELLQFTDPEWEAGSLRVSLHKSDEWELHERLYDRSNR